MLLRGLHWNSMLALVLTGEVDREVSGAAGSWVYGLRELRGGVGILILSRQPRHHGGLAAGNQRVSGSQLRADWDGEPCIQTSEHTDMWDRCCCWDMLCRGRGNLWYCWDMLWRFWSFCLRTCISVREPLPLHVLEVQDALHQDLHLSGREPGPV